MRYMKKIISLGIVFAMITAIIPVVNAENVNINGIIYGSDYTQDGVTYKQIAGCDDSVINLVIPSEVDGIAVGKIKNNAFNGKKRLESVTISEGLYEIGENVFANCENLKNVALPQSLGCIARTAFANCTSLEEIKIPKGVTNSTNTYYGGGLWFSGCSSLKRIEVEEGATVIPQSAFQEIPQSVDFVIPETVNTIGKYAFYGLTWLENLDFLSSAVTTIDNNAFFGCTGLKNIDKIKASAEKINENAFNGCSGITYISFDKLREMGNYAFANCTSLANINLPDTLTSMLERVFANCTSLSIVEIPSSVDNSVNMSYMHEGRWFAGCTNLRTIIIKEGATIIPPAAFAECTYKCQIVIPNTVKTIARNAFRGSTGFVSLYIPESAESVDSSAFSECSDELIVHCGQNFSAAVAATASNIMFSYDGKPTFYRVASGGYSCDTSAYVLSNYVTLISKYKLTTKNNVYDSDKQDISVSMLIPDDCTLIENTVYVNGQKYENYSVENNILTVSGMKAMSGNVKACFTKTGVRPVISQSSVKFKYLVGGYNPVYATESLGVICTPVNAVSLLANPTSNDGTISITGFAPAGSHVDVYADDVPVHSFTGRASATYKEFFKIENPIPEHVYDIKVVIDGGSEKHASVKYSEGAPVLEEFLLYPNNHVNPGECVDLLDEKSGVSNVEFWPKNKYVFKVKYSDTENIDKVYIVSNKNDDVKTIEAVYNPDTGYFEANSFFDPENPSYIPGNVGVMYLPKTKDFEAEGEKIVAENDLFDGKFTAELIEEESTDDMQRVSAYLVPTGSGGGSGSSGRLRMDVTTTKNSGFNIAEAKENGYKFAGNNTYYKIEQLADKIVSSTYDAAKGSLTSAVVEDLDITDEVEVFDTIMGVVDFTSVSGDYSDARAKLEASNDPNKAQKLKDMESAYIEYALSTIIVSSLTVVTAVSAVAAGPGFALAIGIICAICEFNKDAALVKMGMEPDGDIFYFIINWLLDPSGYVYEAVTTNRLSGVTTTVYYKDENNNAVLWNAEDYGQENPLTTNNEGRYSWIVPEGMWQVKYELDGYDTVYSDWLDVPPPQTDVNIGMFSYATPKIEYAELYENTLKLNFTKYMKPETVENIKISDNDGSDVAYTVDYSKEETDLNDTVFAKEYTFTLDVETAVGEVYNVTFADTVKSYADVGMENGQISVTAIQEPTQIIVPAEFEVANASIRRIPVIIKGIDEDDVITAESDVASVISVVDVSKSDENGNAYVEIKANDIGAAQITISANNVKATVNVNSDNSDIVMVTGIEKNAQNTTVSFKNNTGENISSTVFYTAYDENGRLLFVQQFPINTGERDFTVTTSKNIENEKSWKVFMFKNVDTLIPVISL